MEIITVDHTIDVINRFCETNVVPLPRFVASADGRLRASRVYATYRRETRLITVYLDKTTRHESIRDSFPRSRLDFSTLGCACHELGHHVNEVRGWSAVARDFYDTHVKERMLSPYAHMSRHEDFAETFRLFVTNPDLLEAYRPRRFEFMKSVMRLSPIEDRKWRDVIGDSHEIAKIEGLLR